MMERNTAKLTFRFPVQADDSNKQDMKSEEVKRQSVDWSDWQYEQMEAGTDKEKDIESTKINALEIAEDPHDPGLQDEEKRLLAPESPSIIMPPKDVEDEIDRIERMIRETGGTQADREEIDVSAEEASWGKTDKLEEEWTREAPKLEYAAISQAGARSSRPTLIRVALSVFGAVATGLALGLLTLSLFKGDTPLPDLNRDMAVMGTVSDKDAGANHNDESAAAAQNEPSKLADAVSLSIPARTTHVLQYGVFSQAEGAKKAEEELRSLGLAAVRVPGEEKGTERVFAAIADSRNAAMLLSDALKSQDLELYVRPLERKSYETLYFTGDAKLLETFVSKGDVVLDWLIVESSSMLQAKTPAAFDKASMENLRNIHQQWTEEGQRLKKTLNSVDEKEWAKVVQAMNTAINGVNEYNKKPSSAQLWNIQQASIQYSLLEGTWLSRLAG